ncbi:MAG: hypothetical protein AB7G28_07020 [Pirellulales bacterium]
MLDGERKRLTYEQAFQLGCVMLNAGNRLDAAKLFACMEEFTDRGPRAFIMQAFCEASAMRFDNCGAALEEAFSGEKEIATKLQNAFVSYHVGIRKEGVNALIEMVNEHDDLPTICLLLGDMLEQMDQEKMSRKCWSLAVERDREGGAVATVATLRLKKALHKAPASQVDPPPNQASA